MSIGRKFVRNAQKRAEEDVRAWNRAHPVGTRVIRTDDRGNKHLTRTRTEAWLAGSQPLVCVEGVSGGYWLHRISPCEVCGEGVSDGKITPI